MSEDFKGFVFDDSQYPIVKVIATGEEMTLEDVRLLYIKFRRILDKHEGDFIGLIDATDGKWVGGEVRIALGKGQKALEELYIARYQKQILVVPNAIMKMMVKGVNLATKPIVPQKVFSNYNDAYSYAQEEIKKIS